MKECPYCFWEIVDRAKKCKHCWEWVIDSNNPFREEKKKIKSVKDDELDEEIEDEVEDDEDLEDDIDDDFDDIDDDDLDDDEDERENEDEKDDEDDKEQERNRDFYDESRVEWNDDPGSALLVWLLLMIGIAIIGAIVSAIM